MKFLVALLSATLVYGAAHPGHEDHGHIEYQQHDGPHCHDKKDQQCHKIPKEQEHEECYVDYEIVVDVTYIEECQYVTKIGYDRIGLRRSRNRNRIFSNPIPVLLTGTGIC